MSNTLDSLKAEIFTELDAQLSDEVGYKTACRAVQTERRFSRGIANKDYEIRR